MTPFFYFEQITKMGLKRICTRFPRCSASPCATGTLDRLFNLFERYETWHALRSGPPWVPSKRKMIIDITLECNLGCVDCNRSVGKGQAWTHEYMTVKQIEQFITESIQEKKLWFEISIEGGEPTLHPQLMNMIDLLMEYKHNHAPWTNIKLQTNGYGKHAHTVIEALCHAGVDVYNSGKQTPNQAHHCTFNMAPMEDVRFAGRDFSQGCYLPAQYGLGLTMHGYYPHPVCGSIDRVFGFNIGRKSLPEANDAMTDHFAALCPYCGFYTFCRQMKNRNLEPSQNGQMSPVWQQAYAAYHEKKPVLDRY